MRSQQAQMYPGNSKLQQPRSQSKINLNRIYPRDAADSGGAANMALRNTKTPALYPITALRTKR